MSLAAWPDLWYFVWYLSFQPLSMEYLLLVFCTGPLLEGEGRCLTRISLIEVEPFQGWLFSFLPLNQKPPFSESVAIAPPPPSEILPHPI